MVFTIQPLSLGFGGGDNHFIIVNYRIGKSVNKLFMDLVHQFSRDVYPNPTPT